MEESKQDFKNNILFECPFKQHFEYLNAFRIYNGLYETLQRLVLVLDLWAIEEREQWFIVKNEKIPLCHISHIFCVPFPPPSSTLKKIQ